eukprot:1430596-Lingulodinium_polyedra.AAC.1
MAPTPHPGQDLRVCCLRAGPLQDFEPLALGHGGVPLQCLFRRPDGPGIVAVTGCKRLGPLQNEGGQLPHLILAEDRSSSEEGTATLLPELLQ